MNDLTRRLAWMAVSAGSALVAQQLVQRSMNAGWELATHRDPPDEDAADHLPAALAWVAATSALVAVAQLLARRGAEEGWRRATGDRPPG